MDRRRMRRGGLVAAVIAAVLLLAMGDALRRPLFDGWQRLSPRDLSDTKVRVVLIDAESLKALGPWPWSRFHLAKLTQEIAGRGAVAIGYDVLFAEPDRLGPKQIAGLYPELPAAAVQGLPSPDQAFAQIIGEAPVVLARTGTAEAGGTAALPVDASLPRRLPDGFLHFPRVIGAIPELDDVAAGHGLINAEPGGDGIYRGLPLLATVGAHTAPGLAIEVARVAMGASAIGFDGRAVRLGDWSLPVDRHGEMRLRFGHFPESRMISAVDLIRRNPALSLRGTAVLIGLSSAGTVDVAATPIDRKIYGVLVQAQAVDAILRGSGWLERPRWAWAAEWGAAALIVVLALWLVPRRGAASLLVPFASGAMLGAAWLAFDRWSLLLDPIPQVALSSAAAIGIGLSAAAQTRRERERLREALVEERVSAAANEAELEAARSIQQAMLPRAEALAKLDPRVEIAALLEPARSVGGDFFDVVRLDADRVAFAIADVTGKGVPASLFMALSKALAKSAMLREPLPALAPTIQAELSRDAPDEMGLTMLIGVLDCASGEVRLINAGHENPFVLRAGDAEDVAMEGGPPFCVVDFPWPVERLQLAPGETLLLLTDGVTEAQDAEGRIFGRGRLAKAIAGSAAPHDLVAGVLAQVRAFEAGTEASDDLTLLAIRYLG
ncbi:CHASE2 domain-containing protein [Sphingomonas tabacisoli]|uniref:CHASE2 domain-containing protein n=1 Tax=Sphingomonas tabacisoli TaxID=2249466 RepID=A0ABW4I3H4_9SPHN